MTATPKQIVIDKDAFIGINLDSLCEFAKSHFLLVCDALLYECATAIRQKPAALLDKCERLIHAGAYYCPSISWFVDKEARDRHPYRQSIAHGKTTARIRRQEISLVNMLSSERTPQVARTRWDDAQRELLKSSKTVRQSRVSSGDDNASLMKQLPGEKHARLRTILGIVDRHLDIHKIAQHLMRGDKMTDASRFCLSPEWMGWHHIRLLFSMIEDYHYIHVTGGSPGGVCAEHDHQDLEYVLLLSRADAVITSDKKLVEPLARAAFPEKEVFSSLEEVPESYRCDWAGS